jgi:hypothetical protein
MSADRKAYAEPVDDAGYRYRFTVSSDWIDDIAITAPIYSPGIEASNSAIGSIITIGALLQASLNACAPA